MTDAVEYKWRRGWHPPKGIEAEQAAKAILKHSDPDALFEASKGKRHILHSVLWSEGDQVWANKARREYCRQFIASVIQVEPYKERTIETRVVEYIHLNGDGAYVPVNDIKQSQEMLLAYLREAQRLQQQAMDKIAKIGQLMEQANDEADK